MSKRPKDRADGARTTKAPAKTPTSTHEGCDVRLVVAAGDAVKAVEVVRHLAKGPRGEAPWCGSSLGTMSDLSTGSLRQIVNELTRTPKDCTCRKCLDTRLEEIKRAHRLRGDFEPLGEGPEYDNPYERLGRQDLVELDSNELRSLLGEFEGGLLKALPDEYYAHTPAEPTVTFPGSADKQSVMADREARGESMVRGDDAQLDTELGTGLQVENARNGAPDILAVVGIRGEDAEEDYDRWLLSRDRARFQELDPSLWAVVSGEAFLKRIEARLGRPLHAAARALASWPWHWRMA